MMTTVLIIHIIWFGLVNLVLVALGHIMLKKGLLRLSWLVMVVSIAGINSIFQIEHPIIRMLAIIATTFTAMKAIAAIEAYKGKAPALSFKQWALFAGGWAGMRPQPFETLGEKALPGAMPMIVFGVSRIIAGAALILLAHFVVLSPFDAQLKYIAVSGILLVALSLILHFGLLSISAGMWRLSGVNTYYLFRKPATSMSLTEFWSKRWNLAFSEMTSVAIFRPLRSKIGAAGALMASFIFSGLLHELAISLPVNYGYGLPTLYFIIQGTVVLVEKAMTTSNVTFLKNVVLARIWLFFWLVIPMPLLFHGQFIKQIVWPLAGLHP